MLAVGILSFSVTEGKIIHGMTSEPEEELDYLIVLGAQVKKTVPSKALGLRLQKACEYLKEHRRQRLYYPEVRVRGRRSQRQNVCTGI